MHGACVGRGVGDDWSCIDLKTPLLTDASSAHSKGKMALELPVRNVYQN